MHPILYQIGPVTLYSFGLCFAAAVLLGAWLAVRQAARERGFPLPPAALSDLLLAAVLSGIVGGRFLYIVLNWPDYVARPWEVIALWHGGLVYYGGFVGGVLATLWYLRRQLRAVHQWSGRAFLQVLDLLMPSLALAQSIGRLGCFFNGCCYGRPTISWWGMRFPGAPLPLYPTQLFESFGTLLLFVVLRAVQVRVGRRAAPVAPGLLTGLYLVCYGVLRFSVEGLRGDNPRWWLGLTLSQWIGLAVVPLGVWLLRRRRARASSA